MGGIIAALLAKKHSDDLFNKTQRVAGSQALFEKSLRQEVPLGMGYAAFQDLDKSLGKPDDPRWARMRQYVEQTMGPHAQPQAPPIRDPGLPGAQPVAPPPGAEPAAPPMQIAGGGSQGEPAPGILGAEIPPPPTGGAPPAPDASGPPQDIFSQLSAPVSDRDFFSPQGQAIRKIQGELPGMQFGMGIAPVQVQAAMQRLHMMGLPNPTPEQITEYLASGQIKPYPALNPGQQIPLSTGGSVSGGPYAQKLEFGPEGSQPIVFNPNAAGGAPAAGGVPPPPGAAAGVTALPSVAPKLNQQEANMVAAAQRVARSHGIPFDPTKNPRQPLLQIPDQYQSEVQMASDPMLQIRADNLKELRAQRALRSQELALKLQDFQTTHDPAYISGFVNMMKADPDVYFDQSLNSVRPLVAKAWQQDTGLPIPRKLGATMKTGEEASNIALQHIGLVKELIKDPVVQKRIGTVLGHLGNLEETAGMTVGLSPEESEKIQKFRTAMNYMYFREGRALMGGRPPEKLMAAFGKTSVKTAETLPMILGSLAGAEAAAKATVESADRYRFGGKSRAGLPGQITPPPTGHGIPDIGSTFNGGRVLKVTPIPEGQ